MKPSSLLSLILPILFVACNQQPKEDPRLPKLEQEVQSLNAKTDQLNQQLQQLQTQVLEVQTRTAEQVQTRNVATNTNHADEMSISRMKREVEPLVTKIVDQSSTEAGTEGKGDQYSMRVEYDLKHAVYGLSRTQNEASPYLAKVIVPYQKFVSSSRESRSYGNDTREFVFAYTKGKWVLQKQ
jgi:TolA-binding protein